jgi:uncharacterized protein YqgC (DUF456 family)
METITWLRSISFLAIIGLMVAGLLGMIIPFYPGLLIIWIGALLYGLIYGFGNVGIVLFVVITILGLIGSVIDNIITGLGAHHSGVPWLTILCTGLVGFLLTFLNPLAGLAAVPVVLFLLEWRRLGEFSLAKSSLLGLIKGWLSGLLARVAVGFLMVILWIIWVWLA